MPLPPPPASLRTCKKGPRNRRFGDLPYAATEILKLHNALSHHGVGDLQEAGNVGAEHHVARLAALDGGVIAGLEDVLHDAVQLLVDFFEAPAHAQGVLAHFQTGGGDAAGVGSLARRVE